MQKKSGIFRQSGSTVEILLVHFDQFKAVGRKGLDNFFRTAFNPVSYILQLD